jgi:hypothetical protein
VLTDRGRRAILPLASCGRRDAEGG